MDSLPVEGIPTLKVSYQQLCERVRLQRTVLEAQSIKVKQTRENLPKHTGNVRGLIRIKETHSSKELVDQRKIIKSIVGDNLEVESDAERVWQRAWSQWTSQRANFDRVKSKLLRQEKVMFEEIESPCSSLETMTIQLFEENLEMAVKHEVVRKLWRDVHYPVTESLRKLHKRTPDKEKADVCDVVRECLGHFMAFYSGLIGSLQQGYGFELSGGVFTQGSSSPSASLKSQQKKVRQAVNVCHQCYIYMGDISRYSEQLSSSPDWSRPRSYYLKSIHLLPKNGLPYNQLALIAISSHRRFDAVYYYIRSLCSKNTFLSANDSLMALFDETAKKAQVEEANEKQLKEKNEKKIKKKKKKKQQQTATTARRDTRRISHDGSDSGDSREVWIMPGEKTDEDNASGGGGAKEEEPSSPSPDSPLSSCDTSDPTELSRSLVNCFLVVHGKLFSKIGVDLFDHSVEKALSFLELYLEKTPMSSSKDGEKFVKMVAINIFSVYQKAVDSSDSSGGIPFYILLALSFSLNFVSRLISHCSFVLKQKTVNYQSILVLLPALRVWLVWLSTHSSDWVELIVDHRLQSCFHQFSCSLVTLVNNLMQVMESWDSSPVHTDKFWEDKMLAGFIPLSQEIPDFLSYPELSSLTEEQRSQQNLPRIQSITQLLCQIATEDSIPIKHENGVFTVIMQIPEGSPSAKKAVKQENEDGVDSMEEEHEEVVMEEEEDTSATSSDVEDVTSQLQQLKIEKRRLSHQLKTQLQTEETSQSLLSEAKAKGDSVTVRPKYLVPDTNCFIDHLSSLKQLLDSGHFIIAVPLTGQVYCTQYTNS